MVAYMLPAIALLIPLVAIMKGLQLIDTLPGMALGHIALAVPLVTWILIGTFDSIEPELEHAARIDGASRAQALRRVVLPVTVPSIATAAVFGFVLSWNDLLISKVLYVGRTPMLARHREPLDPLNRIEPQLSMAGLIASIPVLTLALLMQKYLIRGLGEGAVSRPPEGGRRMTWRNRAGISWWSRAVGAVTTDATAIPAGTALAGSSAALVACGTSTSSPAPAATNPPATSGAGEPTPERRPSISTGR